MAFSFPFGYQLNNNLKKSKIKIHLIPEIQTSYPQP